MHLRITRLWRVGFVPFLFISSLIIWSPGPCMWLLSLCIITEFVDSQTVSQWTCRIERSLWCDYTYSRFIQSRYFRQQYKGPKGEIYSLQLRCIYPTRLAPHHIRMDRLHQENPSVLAQGCANLSVLADLAGYIFLAGLGPARTIFRK